MAPLLEVVDNVYQIELPLPFALRSVNCYLLQDERGWTIVDTGLNTAPARALWQALFEALEIDSGAINRIVLTHSHPDHYGLAGWLQAFCVRGGSASMPPVLASPREAELANQLWVPRTGWFDNLIDFFARCGLPEALIEGTISGIEQVRVATRPLPARVETLEPGTMIRMGGRTFRVLLTPGHSDGHLIFYDADDRLMLCGDQVLLKITPNISLWPQTEADPLGRYLASLQALTGLDVRLALPGHRGLITDWSGRITELEAHHAERLERMLAAAGPGATPYDVSARTFDFDKLSSHEARFAVAETLAHLEYLVVQNELFREDGRVWRYWRS